MEDSGSIRNNQEMRLNGRKEDPTMVVVVVVVDKFSKSPLFYGGGQFVDNNEQVGGNGVAKFEETREKMTNDDIIVKEFSEKQRYLTSEQRPLEEWWRNHILSQHDEEQANVKQLGNM